MITSLFTGAVLSCSIAGVNFFWGNENQLVLDDHVSLTTSPAISRHVARLHPNLKLYPSHILHRTQVSSDSSMSIYASPSSGEAYRDRQLTTNFEL